MDKIHALLHSLSRKQIKVLNKYLVGFSTRNEGEAKTWELAEFLLKSEKRIPTINECSLKIYHCERDSKIEKLKTRLVSKTLDSLLLDINVERKGEFDSANHMLLKVKKKAALFQVLRLSNSVIQRELSNVVLDEIVSICQKYEFYISLIDNLRFHKWSLGWRQGIKAFDKVNNEISFYEKCNSALSRATDNYYRMLMLMNFSANQDETKLDDFFKVAIHDMQNDYEETNSATVGYFLKFIEFAYAQKRKDYQFAKNVGFEMIEIIRSKQSVYRKSRLGACYDNISECNIFLGEYELALQNLKQAQSYFSIKSTDYFLSKDLQFNAVFYLNDSKTAGEICKILLNSSPAQQGDFRFAKYNFYNACVLFREGQFRECNRILSMKFELSKDRLGWEIAIRVLRIMALIELERYDEVQQMVHSLVKHIERNVRRGDTAHERDKMILKTFQLLEKEGFRKGHCPPQVCKLLEQLKEPGKSFSWQPLSPELIPVHEWMIKKFDLRPPANKIAKTSSKRKKQPA